MLQIAICDDASEQCSLIERLLQKYFSAHPQFAAHFSMFDSGTALLSAVDRGMRFDLYLLDILMPGQNGIQTGVALRDKKLDGEIIYLTTSTDFGIESYQARAFDYLVKPIQEASFFPH